MWPQPVTVLLRTECVPGVVAHDEAVRGPEVGERRGGGEEGGDRGGDTQHHGSSSSLSLAIAMYESSTQHWLWMYTGWTHVSEAELPVPSNWIINRCPYIKVILEYLHHTTTMNFTRNQFSPCWYNIYVISHSCTYCTYTLYVVLSKEQNSQTVKYRSASQTKTYALCIPF